MTKTRPSKEFWKKVYPEVERFYRGRNSERAARVTAHIWYHQLTPAKRRQYERRRVRREAIERRLKKKR